MAAGLVERLVEGCDLGIDGRMPRYVGARQMRPDADDLATSGGLFGHRGSEQIRPVRHRRAAPTHPRVDLEVQPGGLAGELGGRGDRGDQAGGARAEVDAKSDGVGVWRVGRGEQAEHRRGHSGFAQRHRFFDVTDAEPARASGQRR